MQASVAAAPLVQARAAASRGLPVRRREVDPAVRSRREALRVAQARGAESSVGPVEVNQAGPRVVRPVHRPVARRAASRVRASRTGWAQGLPRQPAAAVPA